MDIHQKQLNALQKALRDRPGDPELELRELQLLVAADISEVRTLLAAIKSLLPGPRHAQFKHQIEEAEADMCRCDPWSAHDRLGVVVRLIQAFLEKPTGLNGGA